MNARTRSVVLRLLAISLISLSLIIAIIKSNNETGILDIFLQILRTLGLLFLFLSIILVPLSLSGCNETSTQRRLQRIFLYIGAGILLLALILDAATYFRRIKFWLYTGTLFTIMTVVLLYSDITIPEDSEEEQS